MVKENYLGVNVCAVNPITVIDEVKTIILKDKPSFIVAINPEKIMKCQEDKELSELINSADIQIPDGIGVVIASKLKGGRIKERVTGIDLMQNICKLSAKEGYGVFLLGAKPTIAASAAKILTERFSGLKIVGIQDGYFENEAELLKKIKAAKPQVLFVAMGSPKQENWITKHKDELGVPLCMGVGGSYDVICGNINRAPVWMCKAGLEWLYRLIKEPWRYKRMLVLPKFLIKVLTSK